MLKINATSVGVTSKRRYSNKGFVRGYDIVYEEPIKGPFFVKIGRATNVENRVSSIQTGNPHKVSIEFKIQVFDSCFAEKFLHQELSSRHVNGEWFCLSSNEINEVKSLMEGLSKDITRYHVDGQARNLKRS